MRFQFTLFLIILNLVTFSVIFLLGKKAENAATRIGGLSAMISREAIEATRIELSGKGLEAQRILERNGSAWKIIEPIQWSANYFAINRILNQLQFLEEEASFSIDEIERTGQSLADYGLEDPLIRFHISNANEALELGIGNMTEIGNNVYILGPNKQNVFVVSRQFIDSLLIDLNDLRNREIFNIPVFEVEALSLQIKNSETLGDSNLKVRIARTNNGWIFEAPLTAEANASEVSNTINTLTAARVVEFKSSETVEPILHGLEEPVMRVTLHGNKRQQTLCIGNPVVANGNNASPPTYYARIENNPTVFTVEAAPFDQLSKAEEALRERSILNFQPKKLTSIDLSEGERTIRLQKLETGNWQVIESSLNTDIQPHRADSAIVAELIDNLKNLRASGFAINSPTLADVDRLGFNTPRRRVQLSLDDNTQVELLLAHPENENDKLYARSDKAEYIYTVNRRATLQMIPLNATYYRTRTLEVLPEAAQITDIQLDNLSTGETIFTYALEKPDMKWPEVLVDLSDTERESILTLIETIRRFEVKEYLLNNYEDSYRLDSETTRPWVYQLRARILLPGDEISRSETQNYVFTERFSGTFQVGASEAHDVIFAIPKKILDALFNFTDDLSPPPEANDQPVPDQSEIKPVPEPEATLDLE